MTHAASDPEPLLAHVAHVRQLARRLVFDADLAREVEQETWLAALEHAPRDLRHPRAWLSQVARHAARRLGARREMSRDIDRAHGQERHAERTDAAQHETPPDLVDREQALRRIVAAVGRLPEPVRTTVTLHHLDGLSLREVARRTKTPLETVRSRSKRGLTLLREDLARREPDNASWCLALVQALELAPLRPEQGLGRILRELLLPLTVMSTGLKLTTATGGAALCLVAAWTWMDRETTRPAPSPERPVQEVVAAGLGLPAQESSRAAVEAAPVREASDPPAVMVTSNESEATTGELFVRVVWAEDGSPAAEVPVRLEARALDPGVGVWHTTGRDGTLFLGDQAPTQYMLQTLFGGLAFGKVEAGERREVRLAIPAGLEVSGRVLEREGTPVADATIYLWAGSLHPMFEALPVASTDARGEFHLPSVAAGVGGALAARARGRAPTERVMLSGAAGTSIEIELTFEAPGREVTGRVLDPDGAPLAGAEVVVGSEREVLIRKRTDGTLSYPPMGVLVRTDADGRFEVDAARGELPVQARGKGCAPWKGRLEEGDGWIEIRLERGAWVRGVVKTPAGGPPERATVRNGPPIFFGTHLAHVLTDGSYELGPLGAGEQELVAEGDGVNAKTRLTLRAGEDQVWDPVLGGGRVVRGWIEAPGEDLEGWRVRGYRGPRAGEPVWAARTLAAADGSFELNNVPEGELVVSLFPPRSPFYVAVVEGVVADGPALVLRPEPERMPTAAVVGRLVDERGETLTSADLRIHNPTFGFHLTHPDREDGSFRVGSLAAGEWILELDPLTPGWAVTRKTFQVREGETVELGAVTLGPGGSLEVTLKREAEAAGVPIVHVLDEAGTLADRLVFEEPRVLSRPLSPGVYRLVQPDSETPAREVTVTAGTTTRIEFQVP